MKIIYFTPYFPPQTEAAATRSFWFVKILKNAGHDVKILSSETLKIRLASNKSSAINRLIWENLQGIELLFKIFVSSRNLVILSSPPFFTVLWGALACILRRKEYILDIRDLYPEVLFETGLINEQKIAGKLLKLLVRNMYVRAKKIITVTEGLCDIIESYGVNRPELIMNGYDPEIFYPGNSSDKFEKFTLVFHGNLGKIQNIDTLLKVAQELEENAAVQILVAGEGPKAAEILSSKRKNIHFLGSLSHLEISRLLRKCHVGLSFRTNDRIGKESFPVKVFEYFGSGLPTILSPMGEAGETIERLGLGKQFHNEQISEMVKTILEYQYKKIDFRARDIQIYSRANQASLILNLIDQQP